MLARPPVLVVEDDPGVRRLVEAMLVCVGYAATPAPDGGRALALLADPTRLFAAAVLDQDLPGLTGPEVLARIRPLLPTLAVVVISGNPDPAAVRVVAADPHAEFLSKPFGAATLARVLGRLVGVPAAGGVEPGW